jgi:transcriptional regulator with XRE-family HTH domain
MPIEKFRSIFAKNLRYYMDLNNKSQKDLINDLNLTRSAVSAWYTGKRIPRPEILDILCEYFHIKRSDLVEESNERDDKKELTIEGAKIIEAYNTKSYLKILYDEQLDMTPEAAAAMLEVARQMKKSK